MYNTSESILKQRFSVALSLSYHTLGYTGKEERCIRKERDAVILASEILVPKRALNFFIFNKKVYKGEELSKIFKVPGKLMDLCLKREGYVVLNLQFYYQREY